VIYVFPPSVFLFWCRKNIGTDPGIIYIAHRHMNVEIGTGGHAIPFLGILTVNGIFVAVLARGVPPSF
jgi:hypothetical protein